MHDDCTQYSLYFLTLTKFCLACGSRSDRLLNAFLVHGSNAIPGQWPWQAELFLNGQQICGGSLVTSQHIVTAAHCIRFVIAFHRLFIN